MKSEKIYFSRAKILTHNFIKPENPLTEIEWNVKRVFHELIRKIFFEEVQTKNHLKKSKIKIEIYFEEDSIYFDVNAKGRLVEKEKQIKDRKADKIKRRKYEKE